MILLPSLSGMNMMPSGYALQFIGLFVGITGLVMLWFYRARTAALAPTMPSVSFFFEGEEK